MSQQGNGGVRARGFTKVFAGQPALDAVDLDVAFGEVHALLGVNGSGKSTLIKILAGLYVPEHGAELIAGDRHVPLGSPRDSYEAGLRFIHQDLGLIDSLTVAENLALGGGRTSLAWLSSKTENVIAQRIFEKYALDIDPAALVASLRASEKSMLAIIRAVEDGLGEGGLLVLDEPTAALPPSEVRILMELIRALRSRGIAILYVTHRLPEVYEIADRVTVLREGRRVTTRPVREVASDELVELILGEPLVPLQPMEAKAGREVVFAAIGLAGGTVAKFDLEARAGEVVGITGVVGSGYESVLGLSFGASRPIRGRVEVGGQTIKPGDTREAIAVGLAYAPADRRGLGSVVEWSLRENLTLPAPGPSRGLGWLSGSGEHLETQTWLNRLNVVPANPDALFLDLSGGNQQKVVIARWLRTRARAFLLDEPTIGVDAGARHAIYSELRSAASAGAAVIVSSSDTEELSEICDRVIVMSEGVVVTTVYSPFNPDALLSATLRTSSVRLPASSND